jgi:homospermidine synthase
MNSQIPNYEIYFEGPIIIIGFGSIGSGLLPLIDRHIKQPIKNITVISPDNHNEHIATKYGANFLHTGLTEENYEAVLDGILGDKSSRGFIISVSNEVSSKDLIRYAAKNNAHYIDTVVEPWPGHYFNPDLSKAAQSNYALRESLHELKPELTSTPTAISCCGANPGMVSWFVKEALLNLAKDSGLSIEKPTTKEEWAKLMQTLAVKGVHIAERDTQTGTIERRPGQFFNTWSAEGCMAEVLQPAELGWGTHESTLPSDGHEHTSGRRSAIYLDTPGGAVKVQTWTPTAGQHFGYLVTHNEAISISDYFTVTEGDEVKFRPTCHYSYHPSDAAVESLEELFGERNGVAQTEVKIFAEDEIVSGADELGVLLYGHDRGAYWYGSRLTIEDTRELAPHQNATGLQVTSAIIAGMNYAINHPNEGLIETDDTDHEECLAIQKPYLGQVFGSYTDWKPKTKSDDVTNDPWQFSNIRITEPRLDI